MNIKKLITAALLLCCLVFSGCAASEEESGLQVFPADTQSETAVYADEDTTETAEKQDSAVCLDCDAEAETPANTEDITETAALPELKFRSEKLLQQHYEKHGRDMGFDSAEEYEIAAAAVTVQPEVLHKTEAEDGDDVYYLEETNEFVVVSTDGFLRTYFLPDAGIAYFNRQ